MIGNFRGAIIHWATVHVGASVLGETKHEISFDIASTKSNNRSVITSLQKGNLQAERNGVLKLSVEFIPGPLLRRLRGPRRSPCAVPCGGAGSSALLFPAGGSEHNVEPRKLGGMAEMQSRTHHHWAIGRRWLNGILY